MGRVPQKFPRSSEGVKLHMSGRKFSYKGYEFEWDCGVWVDFEKGSLEEKGTNCVQSKAANLAGVKDFQSK